MLLQAEEIFSENRTTEQILSDSATLTGQLAAATDTDGVSLLPTELNVTNNILSSVIAVLENSLSNTTSRPAEVTGLSIIFKLSTLASLLNSIFCSLGRSWCDQ